MKIKNSRPPFLCLHSFAQNSAAPLRFVHRPCAARRQHLPLRLPSTLASCCGVSAFEFCQRTPVRLRLLFLVSAQIYQIYKDLPTGRLTKLCCICDKVLSWSRRGFSRRLGELSGGIGKPPRRPTAAGLPAEFVGPMPRHFCDRKLLTSSS